MVDWASILPPSVVTDSATPQDPHLAPPINNTTPTTSGLENGPPYLPGTAQVGGVPTPPIDNPISAVLTFLFLVAAAAHMTIFQIWKRRDHLFVFSAMMFAFSLIRGVALVLRMAWASHSTNVRLAIASGILTQAGTVLVFIINLFFAQRILRGYHPGFGWSKPANIIFKFLFASVVISLIMIIATTVQSFFTLDVTTRDRDHKVQLFGSTYLAVLAFLPIPIVVLSILTPRKYVIEKFGTGRWRTKLLLLLFTSTIMTLGAGFRAGTNFAPRPLNNPAWYHGRGPYYAFNYALDLITTYLYLGTEFHKRFFVPNGAKGPGSYMGNLPMEKARRTASGSTQPTMVASTEDGYSPSVETLAPPQYHYSASSSSMAPSNKAKSVGYKDSISSLKHGNGQKRQGGKRLSKAQSRSMRRSNASLYSQETFVGSREPSFMNFRTGSVPSLSRDGSGPAPHTHRYGEHHIGDPANLPPVPVMPAAFESYHNGGSSREGSARYVSGGDMNSSRRTSSTSFTATAPVMAPTAAVLGTVMGSRNRDSTSTSTDKRSSDVLSDMIQKMESARHSVESHRKAPSVERTSEGLRMWSPTYNYPMSGAMGADTAVQQRSPIQDQPRRSSRQQSLEIEQPQQRMQAQFPSQERQPEFSSNEGSGRNFARSESQTDEADHRAITSDDSSSYHTGAELDGFTSDGSRSRPQQRRS